MCALLLAQKIFFMSLYISNGSVRKDLVTKTLSKSSLERTLQYIGLSLALAGILLVLLSALHIINHSAALPGKLTGIGLIIGSIGAITYGYAIRKSERILREKKIAERNTK